MLPPQYSTIKQPEDSRICAACVAAMAVGESLEYATDRMPAVIHEDGKPWYRMRSVLAFLGGHGIHCGLRFASPTGEPLPPDSFDDLENVRFSIHGTAAMVTVESETFPGFSHLIFWDGAVVRDPNRKKPNTCDLEGYKILDWTPLCYFEEEDR